VGATSLVQPRAWNSRAYHTGVVDNRVINLAGLDPSSHPATFRDSQVAVVRKVEPKPRGQTEMFFKANGSVGADSPIISPGWSAKTFVDLAMPIPAPSK
jgi:hypothetical protein